MKTKNTRNDHVIDGVFVVSLLLMFVISALSVIAIGASIYKKNVSLMSDNYSHRIASAYITEKVRQSDIYGAVYVRNMFGENVLVMKQDIGGTLYDTYIYEYDGYLMELFARDDLKDFYPQSGQKILKISGLDINEASASIISVKISLENGIDESLYIAKRSYTKD